MHFSTSLACLASLLALSVAAPPKPSCDRYKKLQKSLTGSRPFSLVPNSRKVYVMSKSPKVISEPMVEEILNQYLKQMNRNLDNTIDACNKDKLAGCGQYLLMMAQMASIPPLFLPADVERALIADLPDKATPLLLKILADAYFEEYEQDMNDLALDCIGGGVDACPAFVDDAFSNGRISYGRDNVNATLVCNSGYKARTFNDAIDAVQGSRSITIQCTDSGNWDAVPQCLACEYGWHTHFSVPGCYRLFEGVLPYQSVDEYEKVCVRHKGHLASLHSDNELGFIANRLMESGDDEAVVGLSMGSYDDQGKFNAGEKQNFDGSPGDYDGFARGDSLSKGNACTKVVKDSRIVAMYAVKCEQPATHRFICKRPPSKALG